MTITRKILPIKLGQFERKMGKRIVPAIRRADRRAAPQIVGLLKKLSLPIKDRGKYQRSWFRKYRKPYGVTVGNRSKHATFVERGRRPGRMPPVGVIRGWLKRRGRPQRLAWPIARAIGRRGIKARPVMYSEKFRRGAAKIYLDYLEREMRWVLRA